MAVRPASRGPSGVVYALLFFVFLALVGLGLAIMFYSQLEEARVVARQSDSELTVFVRPNETNSAAANELKSAAGNNRSVFAEQQLRLQQLKGWINGQGDTSLYNIERELIEVGVSDGKTAINVLSNRKKELAEALATAEEAREAVKAATAEVAKLKNEYAALDQAGKSKVDDLTKKIATYQTSHQAYQSTVSKQIEDLEAKFKAASDDFASKIREKEAELASLNNDLNKAKLRINELIARDDEAKPEAPDLATQIDGRIVSVTPEENVVYIDLGLGDHLVLGMTFEVFDVERGVEVGPDGELRGKASIEVIDLGENSSTARIVRGSISRPVVAGDVIANAVYDKTRVYKFYVFGEFNLDGQGEPSYTDYDTVVSLIRKWGGEVANPAERERRMTSLLGKGAAGGLLLPLDTDFLVIGEEPEVPAPIAPGAAADPREVQKAIAAKKKWETYLQLRREAQELSIPLITQHRFLALIGYYRNQ